MVKSNGQLQKRELYHFVSVIKWFFFLYLNVIFFCLIFCSLSHFKCFLFILFEMSSIDWFVDIVIPCPFLFSCYAFLLVLSLGVFFLFIFVSLFVHLWTFRHSLLNTIRCDKFSNQMVFVDVFWLFVSIWFVNATIKIIMLMIDATELILSASNCMNVMFFALWIKYIWTKKR